MSAPRNARLTAYAGAAAVLAYGALKVDWALGGRLGARGTPPWVSELSGFEHFLALWGTVLLAVLAAGILLALVQPWGRRLPRWPVRALAWLGAAVMTPVGLIGSVQMAAILAGVVRDDGATGDGSLAPEVYAFVYGSFLVLGLAFAATAWLTRPAASLTAWTPRATPASAAPTCRP